MDGVDVVDEVDRVGLVGYSLDMTLLPALRALDVSPMEEDGQTFICLSDPEGYVEGHFALSPAAFFVAACLDGTATVHSVRGAFREQFGASIPDEDIERVVQFLDTTGLLHTEAFFKLRDETRGRFGLLTTRPAWLAGKSYPDEPEALREFLDGMLRGRAREEVSGGVRCLIAPHIDFGRGAAGYSAAYGHLAGAVKPGLIFIFGVAHAGGAEPFILTRKHFDTPLGTLSTATDVVDRLAAACEWDPFHSEIAHRTEHSIEFQAVMLAHILGEAASRTRIVPILCGYIDESLPEVGRFLSACRDEVRAADALVVAGADLAHVGRRFGDDFDIDETVVRAVEARDREDLEFASRMEADSFFKSVMKDSNERNVCGLGCIYSALKAVDGLAGPGRLLHYDYAEDAAGGIVTFAGLSFPRQTGE